MSSSMIRFESQAAFDAWHLQAMAALAIPNAATLTSAYTYVLPGADGFFYAPVDDVCPTELLEGRTQIDTASLLRDPETGEVMGAI